MVEWFHGEKNDNDNINNFPENRYFCDLFWKIWGHRKISGIRWIAKKQRRKIRWIGKCYLSSL